MSACWLACPSVIFCLSTYHYFAFQKMQTHVSTIVLKGSQGLNNCHTVYISVQGLEGKAQFLSSFFIQVKTNFINYVTIFYVKRG